MRGRHTSRKCLIAAFAILLCGVSNVFAQQTATIQGKVLDSRTGEPISKALVSIRERQIETTTDESGEFRLTGLDPGDVELYVTTVGYSLIRRQIRLETSTAVEIEVQLGPSVLKRTDEVSVTAEPFARPEPTIVSEHTLTESEIKNLSSILVDDPLRSVQSLPGVTTGDDFAAQFSARGAGFRSIGFNLDGVLLEAPFHAVSDIEDGGSLSTINSDVVESVTFLGGGFPSRFGDRTAAELDIRTRDGNRQRFTNTATAGLSGLGWTSEGPIGSSRKVSWLGSVRKSYLDYLIDRITDDPDTSTFVFGFYDGFGKLTFDPNQRHQVRISGNFGNSRVDQSSEAETLGVNSFLLGDRNTRIGQADWRWIPLQSLVVQTAFSVDSTSAKNVNRNHEPLFESDSRQIGMRQEASWEISARNRLDVGYGARRLEQNAMRRRFSFSLNQFRTTDAMDVAEWQPGGYVQDTVNFRNSRLTVTYGGRVDHSSASGQTVWAPRAAATVALSPNTRLALAFGQYAQFPTFFQLQGEFGNPDLRAERATHYTLEFERLINDKTRIRIEGYDREDRSGVYSAASEFRLVNGVAAGPRPGTQLQNTVRGYARGIEVFVQRRSANRLLGWISYSYAHARSEDAATGLHFDNDFDQRHTVNVFASYRWTSSLNLSAKYRYGSNFPIAGFYRMENGRINLSEERNAVRMPAYSRLDLRVNKAFHFDRWQLTLFGEVVNALKRKNVRYTSNVDTTNGRVSIDRDDLFPLLPLAGIRLEF